MPEKKEKPSADLSLKTMLAASTAGAIATAAVSGAGIAGTLLGGAVFPVLITLAREMVLRAADRAATVATKPVTAGDREPSPEGEIGPQATAAPPPGESGPEPEVVPAGPARPLMQRVRWRRVAVTGGAAVALVVGVFTAGDLVLGESPVADRSSTFFARDAAPATTTPDPTPEPADPAAPALTETEPAEPVPPATTTAPEETTTAPDATEAEPVPPPAETETAPEVPAPEGAAPAAPTGAGGPATAPPDVAQVPLP